VKKKFSFKYFIVFVLLIGSFLMQSMIAFAQEEHFYFKETKDMQKSIKLGFGFYGLAPSGNMLEDFDSSIKSDVINTYVINAYSEAEYVYALQQANSVGSQVFLAIQGALLVLNPNYVENSLDESKTRWILSVNWQAKFDKIVENCKNSGAYDALAGWYVDEPFCFKTGKTASGYEIPNGSITPRDFLTISKYNSEKIGKRFFAIMGGVTFCLVNRSGLSSSEFANRNRWIDPFYFDTPQITPEMTKYVTDTGINNYDDEGYYDSYYDDLRLAMGSSWDNAKIWHIPGTMKFRNSPMENRVTHLNKLYDMLKKEKNPGGLLGYYWSMGNEPTSIDLTSGDIGAKWIFDPNYNSSIYNKNLALRTAEIAREMTNEKRVLVPSSEGDVMVSSIGIASSLTEQEKKMKDSYVIVNQCENLEEVKNMGNNVVILNSDEGDHKPCFQFKLSPNAKSTTISLKANTNLQENILGNALVFWIKVDKKQICQLDLSISDNDYEKFNLSQNKNYYLLSKDKKALEKKSSEAIPNGYEGYVLIPFDSFLLDNSYKPINNKIDKLELVDFSFINTTSGQSVLIDSLAVTNDINYIINMYSLGIDNTYLILIFVCFILILMTIIILVVIKKSKK